MDAETEERPARVSQDHKSPSASQLPVSICRSGSLHACWRTVASLHACSLSTFSPIKAIRRLVLIASASRASRGRLTAWRRVSREASKRLKHTRSGPVSHAHHCRHKVFLALSVGHSSIKILRLASPSISGHQISLPGRTALLASRLLTRPPEPAVLPCSLLGRYRRFDSIAGVKGKPLLIHPFPKHAISLWRPIVLGQIDVAVAILNFRLRSARACR